MNFEMKYLVLNIVKVKINMSGIKRFEIILFDIDTNIKINSGDFCAIKKLIVFQINLYIKFEIIRTNSSMEQMKGVEPSSPPWQGEVLAVEPHLQNQVGN